MKRKEFLKKLTVAAGVICLSASLLAGCGNSSSSSSSASAESSAETETHAGSSSASDTVPDEVKKELKSVTGNPDFFASDFGSVDARKAMKGRKIMLVAYDSTNDWCVNYVKMAQAVYQRLGASVKITYCDGTADSWNEAIQSATNQKYDAVDLFGISDIGQVKSSINEAKAAGVYVQDTHGSDVSDTSSPATASVGCDYERAGELMAMKIIDEVGSPKDVNCLVVADVGWGADSSVRKGIEKVFNQYGCKYTVTDVSITDWTEGIGNAVRNAFVADDSYNGLLTYYDNMCLYAVPALQELGIDLDSVTIGSFNGNPGLVDYVKNGNMDFDLGESIGWAACHAADCMARHFAGKKVHNDSGFAMYFIDSGNVKDYLDPDTGKASYSCDGVQNIYLPGYRKLWGVDLKGVFDKVES